VNSSQQVAGALVTVLGIATPILMIANGSQYYLTFGYIPQNKSLVEIKVPDELFNDDKNNMYIRNVSSSGFLRTIPVQIEKHTERFDLFLMKLFRDLELRYTTSQR